MPREKNPTSLPTCAACKRELGAEVGVLPIFVDDCARTPGEQVKHEAFCPRCFVYVRAPKEPERFKPGGHAAAKCLGKCGHEQVIHGPAEAVVVRIDNVPMMVMSPLMPCGQCGSRNLAALPPK